MLKFPVSCSSFLSPVCSVEILLSHRVSYRDAKTNEMAQLGKLVIFQRRGTLRDIIMNAPAKAAGHRPNGNFW